MRRAQLREWVCDGIRVYVSNVRTHTHNTHMVPLNSLFIIQLLQEYPFVMIILSVRQHFTICEFNKYALKSAILVFI